jgi:hypothetical protein
LVQDGFIMRRSTAIVPVAVLALLAPLDGVTAQNASPAAGGTLPACTAEPRSVDELVGFFFGPGGEPLATPLPADPVASEADLPQGDPADAETEADIDATVREFLACFPAGQYARGFALLTDEAVREFGPDLSDPTEDTAGEVRSLLESQLAGTPAPAEEEMADAPQVEGPCEARVLDDGRAGAVWTIESAPIFLILEEQQDGRWLIDAFIAILDGDAAEATPAS